MSAVRGRLRVWKAGSATQKLGFAAGMRELWNLGLHPTKFCLLHTLQRTWYLVVGSLESGVVRSMQSLRDPG